MPRLARSARWPPALGAPALLVVGLLAMPPGSAAQEPPSGDDDPERALLELLAEDRAAHLDGDAPSIASRMAETIVEVTDGAVATRTRADVERFFEEIFSRVAYAAWEDAEPPTIRLSEDGTMAWVVRRVHATIRPRTDATAPPRTFTSAYTSTYERSDGTWRMTSVTSTFARPQAPPPETH